MSAWCVNRHLFANNFNSNLIFYHYFCLFTVFCSPRRERAINQISAVLPLSRNSFPLSVWVCVYCTNAFDWVIKHSSFSVQVGYSRCWGICVENYAEISFPDLMYHSKWFCHEFNKMKWCHCFSDKHFGQFPKAIIRTEAFLCRSSTNSAHSRVLQLTQRTRTQWLQGLLHHPHC